MGYNDNFYVSNYGRVYDVANKKFLTPYKLNNGRLAVDIKWNGRKYMYQLDKLVVNTWFHMPFNFVGKPILSVEHKDGDITNNSAGNLYPLYEMEADADDIEWTIEKPSGKPKEYDKIVERIIERGKMVAKMASDSQKKKTEEYR